MSKSRLLLSAVLATAVLAGGVARLRASRANAALPATDDDGRAYLFGALNLARHRTLSSHDPAEAGPRAPALYRGPLLPAVLALSADDAGREGPADFFWRVQGWSGLAYALLGALLGALAVGPLAGLAAGALVAWDPLSLQHAGTLNIQLFFGCLTAFVGLALLRWSAAPTPARAAAAGLAVGASLLARSTLAPFLLFLPLWLAAARPNLKKPLHHLAAFWGVALLCLLPWLGRNLLLHGRLAPLETGVVEYLVVAGASGAVSDDFAETPAAPASPAHTLADAGRARRGPLAALAEAARLLSRETLGAVLARAGFWGWGLLAWVAAALVLRRARREDLGLWTLGGLAVYWNIHLFLLSSARHFIPALAPLAAVAAAAFAARRPAPPAAARLADVLLAMPALLLLVAWGAIAFELTASPWSGKAARALDAAEAALDEGRAAQSRRLLAGVEDGGPPAWQLVRAARLRQRLGEHARCAGLLAAVARAHPDAPRPAADAAVCAALAGDFAAAERHGRAALAADPAFLPAALTVGSILENRGRKAEAVKVYDAALAASKAPAEHELRRALMNARLAALGRARP